MTPYKFGQKLAGQISTPQPMPQAMATQSKLVPAMLSMARSSGTNPINIVPRIEQNIKVRTGQFPSTWETTQMLMDGLPFPYPVKSK